MNQFNHDFKKIYLAVGISEQRMQELKDMLKKAWKESSCKSDCMELILNNGLSVIEAHYMGFMLGQIVEKQSGGNRGSRGSIGAKMMGPNGLIDVPDEIAEKLYNLLKGFKPDLDEPD